MRYALFVLSSLICSLTFGQFDLQSSLNYDQDALIANPALFQDHKYSLQTGAINTGGVSTYELENFGSSNGDKFIVSGASVRSNIVDPTSILANYDLTTLAFNLRLKKSQVGFSHRFRNTLDAVSPPDLIQLAALGNQPLAGERLNLIPTAVFTSFQEFGVHFAHQFGEKFSLGVRANYLNGNVNASVVGGSATVETDPESFATIYQLDFNANTAGIPFNLSDENYAINFDPLRFGEGNGGSITLGLVYRPFRTLEVAASIQDVGAIFWDEAGRRHSANGSGIFEGVTGNVFDENFEFAVDAVVDELRSDARIETVSEKYTTRLSPKLMGHVRKRIGDATDITASTTLINGEETRFGVAAGVAQQFGDFLHVGGHLGLADGNFIMGLRASVMVAGIKVSASSDNVSGLLDRYGVKAAHFRLGVSLNVRRIKVEKPTAWFDDVPVTGRTTPDNHL